jgi:DNA repair protein RAD50
MRADMEDKESRIEKIREEIKASKYEERTQDVTNKIRVLQEQGDTLNIELKNLTLQADSRAKLDINRADLTKKKRDSKAIVDANSSRFKRLVGSDLQAETMENKVDQALRLVSVSLAFRIL